MSGSDPQPEPETAKKEEAPIVENSVEESGSEAAPEIETETAGDIAPAPSTPVLVLDSGMESVRKEIIPYLETLGLTSLFSNNLKAAPVYLSTKQHVYKAVRCVIVLLTGDEFVFGKHEKPHQAVLRAQQSVVFEMGYWVGRLGRDQVIALYHDQKSFRNPTDFPNAIFIPFDLYGTWKKELCKKLQENGILHP